MSIISIYVDMLYLSINVRVTIQVDKVIIVITTLDRFLLDLIGCIVSSSDEIER